MQPCRPTSYLCSTCRRRDFSNLDTPLDLVWLDGGRGHHQCSSRSARQIRLNSQTTRWATRPGEWNGADWLSSSSTASLPSPAAMAPWIKCSDEPLPTSSDTCRFLKALPGGRHGRRSIRVIVRKFQDGKLRFTEEEAQVIRYSPVVEGGSAPSPAAEAAATLRIMAHVVADARVPAEVVQRAKPGAARIYQQHRFDLVDQHAANAITMHVLDKPLEEAGGLEVAPRGLGADGPPALCVLQSDRSVRPTAR